MPVRRNKMGREIWFERWLWSWMPCHWKGWAAIAGFNASFGLLLWISGAMDKPDTDGTFLLIIPYLVLSWWFAERHSP